MNKNSSRTKIVLAIISLIITFFVWQQGLRESLQRPSVSFDISQKEIEIIDLAIPAIPKELKNIFAESPREDMIKNLSKVSFDELTERNKLIWIILKNDREKTNDLDINVFNNFEYKKAAEYLQISNLDKSFKPNIDLISDFRNDKYLLNLLTEKFNLNSDIITYNFHRLMLLKILIIRTIPIFSILFGSILVLKAFVNIIRSRKINWKEYKPLNLDLIDMVLLISGGFVVLGEVVSPVLSITIVELFSKNFAPEITQSLKIFFGYIFMAIPPLFIIYQQIKFINKQYSFKKDYFQFNYKPLFETLKLGFKGWIMIIPFVLIISLLMDLIIKNQAGSNPLLEIVLNNNNYFAFILLFITTTIIAPLFEEIIFRGVLLPVLSRDFGEIIGILISSFVFALAHLSLNELPPLFVLGIGLGITRMVSGRLLSSVFMHSLWNGLTFVNLFLLRT